jgi:glycosyltransferase involved in cell wall biosynthesis
MSDLCIQQEETTPTHHRLYLQNNNIMRKGITMLTTYPTQACGIATFSQDLVTALTSQFTDNMYVDIAVIENGENIQDFPQEVKHRFDPSDLESIQALAYKLNSDPEVSCITIQHEFGLFYKHEENFMEFLSLLTKPIVVVFHTVLPHPNRVIQSQVENVAHFAAGIIVMTDNSKEVLVSDYNVEADLITVIPHGTHLVKDQDIEALKEKHGYGGRKILSTFGLMSAGKSLETTIKALPGIIKENPEVLFLAIGKTHPTVVKNDGEVYRDSLEALVDELGVRANVEFINKYTSLPELLEYLQMTDVYLFTSKDPNQAVSGTLSYALSCGCPIVSTPIPHARELVKENNGLIFPFEDSNALASAVNKLFGDDEMRINFSLNSLHYMAPTSWDNVANLYMALYQKVAHHPIPAHYNFPEIDLSHVKAMTTKTGMYQFAQLGIPDPESGYTLDDNARALIAVAKYYELTKDEEVLPLIKTYIAFIELCQHQNGYFLNYVDENKQFTDQNFTTNLADSNGRAIWALGYVVSLKDILPETSVAKAEKVLKNSLQRLAGMHSPRAIGFAIKGLSFYHKTAPSFDTVSMIMMLADRLVQFYRHESGPEWKWFESYLTYANSVLPEALLYAYEVTGNAVYGDIARSSFDFLLSHTYANYGLKVISNNGWMQKGETREFFGEQPIDVAYTVMALGHFYKVYGEKDYLHRMEHSFNWFLGNNHLKRMIYNRYTGGCWDGLEETHVNLNQGAESTVSYLMARLTIDEHIAALKDMQDQDYEFAGAELTSANGEAARKLELDAEIAAVTREMEKYPEVYLKLSETPVMIADHEEAPSLANTEKYLSFLTKQLNKQEKIGKVS